MSRNITFVIELVLEFFNNSYVDEHLMVLWSMKDLVR
jgi:hypothetical protein